MRNLVVAAIGVALLLSPVSSNAQTTPAAPPAPPPPYGMSIGFDAAKKAIAAAEAEAKKNNWAVAIAIVDTGGHLVTFSRLDNTQIGSVEIALGKARTANSLKRATKALQDTIAQGGAGLRLLGVKDILPIEGGVPIVVDGKIIGGIGVSGVTAQQDAEVATAGANAAK